MTVGMQTTPVLLFYDGHERRAEQEVVPRLISDIHRNIRVVANRIRRKQVRSGYYTWFHMLIEALESVGYETRINDFRVARRAPDFLIGLVGYPSVLDKVRDLPNPRVIGPGLFSSPLDRPALFEDPRNRLFLSTCQWHTDMFAPFYGNRLRRWFGGFDVARYKPGRPEEKEVDVLVYDKVRFDRDGVYSQTVAPFLEMLEATGRTYQTIRYGDYVHQDYLRLLRRCRTMAFFCESETQGMAYQECLALDVPIFAWDEGIWPDPKSKSISSSPIPCTSVPYFDDGCGVRFRIHDMLPRWGMFWQQVDSFRPREFVARHMTLQASAERYLAACRDAVAAP